MTAPAVSAGPHDPGIRLHVETPLAAGATVAPTAEQSHYLKNVMRTAPGDSVRLFNGRDGEWLARVESLGRKGAALAVTAQTRHQQPEPDLWLCFAPVKKARIDFVAQKASELGVSALQPVLTRHTQVARVNEARMRANAIEAAEQCARLTVPAVLPPRKLEDLIGDWPAHRHILLLDETQTGIPIVETLRRRGDAGGRPWAVFVGPEGGYAPEELDLLRRFPNVTPVGLGGRLLRADTAAIAALACWQAVLGDWTAPRTDEPD
ncbi:MAG: 16S rRNA (uracil(1498)-N(3))-methyltransferase [Rhodospirillaceae bacterium]|nr:16S rRNA (uracil(1498)-N(3))-methyltransferase [Rhodospirillaceae bacterium]MYB14020.1 16S rRNA (uracil(1498)-N(3))-methyltransferase [Rhodospirillaceae bacterium]MYI47824.1 16S rRNA (uracil(1498)-N(3))-methyltransferase [Rhodospirillaceae bacterium]